MAASIIDDTIVFVRQLLENAESGHDWWHIYRVWKVTKLLLQTENGDPLVCELAALVHDIGDHKFTEDSDYGPSVVSEFFLEKGMDQHTTGTVIRIMKNISFSRSFDGEQEKTPELMIVQDADMLDAMGAIGIARAFNYGGYKNRPMYDPDIPPARYSSSGEYTGSTAPTLNHFHEKLLLLKDRMNTETGRKLAEERHIYMQEFLDRFLDEWIVFRNL